MQAQALEERSDLSWCWRDAKTRLTWVFGMRWFPSLGHKGRRHLYRNLRQQGFGWAVTHGKSLSLVGVQSTQTGVRPTRHTMSAAVAFACAHPQGVHALCLEISGVGVWFVASSQGCVLSETDRWFDTLEQAQEALKPLRERHDPMSYEHVVWSTTVVAVDGAIATPDHSTAEGFAAPPNPTSNEGHAQSGATVSDVPAFLRGGARKSCQFCKLPAAPSAWPLLLAFGCLGAAALLVVHRLWWVPSVPPVRSQPVLPTPMQASVIKVHDPDRLNDVFMAWQQLPVDPEGWLLKGVRCRFIDQSFQCVANYQRQRADADNAGLARHAPAGWQFEPQSLDQSQLRRHLPAPTLPTLASALMTTGEGLTRLQQLSAELASTSVGTPRPLPGSTHSAPLASLDAHRLGQVGQVSLVKHAVSMRLALRQRAKLLALRLPMRWQQIDLLLVQGAQIDARHGYVMVALQGDLIAQAQQPGERLPKPGHTPNARLSDDSDKKQDLPINPQIKRQANPQAQRRETSTIHIEGEPHEFQ